MRKNTVITALPAWKKTVVKHQNNTCVVKDWELVSLEIQGKNQLFLYGTVVSDYKCRWQSGDYVFTSLIIEFDKPNGLVKTRNSQYCLQGDGEMVFPTLEEAGKMKSIGQSLHTIRALEVNIGKISVKHSE